MAEKPRSSSKKRGRPGKRVAAKTAGKQREARTAYIVAGDGTDEEIAARCAKDIPDWERRDDRIKAETVRLMRLLWSLPVVPLTEVGHSDEGVVTLEPPEGANVTLWALRLVETFASNSMEFGNERLEEIFRHLKRARGREPTTQELMALLAFVRGAKPTDTVQSSLAIQMAATHDAAMRALGRMEVAEWAEHVQLFGNLGTKLLNAYTRQAETLAKLQRGGEQVIKHVHIDNRGGQAVVTEQLVTGGQNGKVGDQCHGKGPCRPALPGQDPQGHGVPIASREGEAALQDAWWHESGRA